MDGMRYGNLLVDKIANGSFKKDNRKNHADDFTLGGEQMALDDAVSYLGSCTYLLDRLHLKEKGMTYYG